MPGDYVISKGESAATETSKSNFFIFMQFNFRCINFIIFVDNNMICKHGELKLNIGDELHMESMQEFDMFCRCEIPPLVTCRLLQQMWPDENLKTFL